ncbi:MAG: XRE family transcriptional regulator [Xanthomonadales bacterium PRO6]|nr:hypothetical protein [Xanthomonadales bacterium]MCE7932779.1 XRE family transcriptional regulator [Xanthomonadales bacterium PRO6]
MGSSSIRGFAREARLSEGVLHSYLSGDTYPTLDRLDQIAAAAGRPPGWFIGAGEAILPSQPVRPDVGSLQAAVETVDTALELAGVAVGAADRAALYVSAYELLQGAQSVPQATAQVLKLIMGGKR